LGSGFGQSFGVAVKQSGTVYVADISGGVDEVRRSGAVTAIGLHTFLYPWGVAVGPDGGVYVADSGHGAIRKIERNGSIATVSSVPSWPTSLALDGAGNIYVAAPKADAVYEIVRSQRPGPRPARHNVGNVARSLPIFMWQTPLRAITAPSVFTLPAAPPCFVRSARM
jgi:hypothetical protein